MRRSCMYVENSLKIHKKLLELMNEFGKVTDAKLIKKMNCIYASNQIIQWKLQRWYHLKQIKKHELLKDTFNEVCTLKNHKVLQRGIK